MKLKLWQKLVIICFMLFICSCIQQEKSQVHSDFIVIKYTNSDNDLSRSELLFKAIEKSFGKSNMKIDLLQVENGFSFEDEIQRQIKDFNRKYIFIFTDYPKEKLNLFARQNPKTFFIVMDNQNDTNQNKDLRNVKYITFDDSKIIELLGYSSAYWTNFKDSEQGKIAYLYDNNSIYKDYLHSFKKGVNNFNKENGMSIHIIEADLDNQMSQASLDKLFDLLIKQNAVVYFPATDMNYYTLLRKIQTVKKYTIGLETDMFYYKPEFQDVVILSESIDYEMIARTIINAVNTGKTDQLNIQVSPENQNIKLSPFHNFDSSISNNFRNKMQFSTF